MNENAPKPQVLHNASASRFELRIQNQVALLNYDLRDGTIIFTHTGVPTALEGRGVGSQLARAGLDYARDNSLRVIAACSFVASYIERHPEFGGLLKS